MAQQLRPVGAMPLAWRLVGARHVVCGLGLGGDGVLSLQVLVVGAHAQIDAEQRTRPSLFFVLGKGGPSQSRPGHGVLSRVLCRGCQSC